MKCPFCGVDVDEDAPLCLECGYRMKPAPPPSGKIELTDEQIMALAGFHTAQQEMTSSARLAGAPGGDVLQKRMKKVVMFVVMGFLVPAVIGLLYNNLNHTKDGGLGLGDAAKMIQMQKGDSQMNAVEQDLAKESKGPTKN